MMHHKECGEDSYGCFFLWDRCVWTAVLLFLCGFPCIMLCTMHFNMLHIGLGTQNGEFASRSNVNCCVKVSIVTWLFLVIKPMSKRMWRQTIHIRKLISAFILLLAWLCVISCVESRAGPEDKCMLSHGLFSASLIIFQKSHPPYID